VGTSQWLKEASGGCRRVDLYDSEGMHFSETFVKIDRGSSLCVCFVTLILSDISLDSSAIRKYFIIRKNLASFPMTHNTIVTIKSFL
jgi:hypothetical protein